MLKLTKLLLSVSTLSVMVLVLPLLTGCGDDETKEETVTFNLTISGADNGSITLDPAGGEYEDGTSVQVTAVPDMDYVFDGWTGDLTGTTNPTTIVMDGDKTIGATFVEEIVTYTLTVEEPENGSIDLDPVGGVYDAGTEVTVTADPDSGYALSGWTGDLSGTTNPTTITMDGDKTIGATFGEAVRIDLSTATHGSYTIEPPITTGSAIPFGTDITITATPDSGYVLDSIFKMFWIFQPYWAYYAQESLTSPATLETTPDDARFLVYGGDLNMYVVGAYFIPDDYWEPLDETFDVVYAQPGSKPLKYDVYAPVGASDLPIVVIIHGGGWSTNTEDIMRGQARYIAGTGDYVAVSIDYRLTSDLDDPAPGFPDMIEDVFGAIAHIQEHADEYGGDPMQIAVTGDSAGGHLAAVVAVMSNRIGDGGYDGEIGSEFMPTYIPNGMTVVDVRDDITAAVMAAAPSYGVFTGDGWDDAVAPLANIPNSTDRVLPPQYCQVGSADTVVGTAGIQAYVNALQAAGQTADYVEIAGANHAYYDWKPDAATQSTFETVGMPALDLMIAFFDSVFYPE